MKLTSNDFSQQYDKISACVTCSCTFLTDFAGGQPADEAGIRAFVEYQLGLIGEDAEKAIARIKHEEIGDKENTPENGEIPEELSYGINVIRKTGIGPYIGPWMIHACLKQAASRAGIFKKRKGSKGDMTETGFVEAYDFSIVSADKGQCIYVTSSDLTGPAKTFYRKFQGKVQTPQGAKSIVHDTECIGPGARFAFKFRFLPGISKDDILNMLSLIGIVGLGSCKSLGCGKFRIDECQIEMRGKSQ